MHGRPARLTMTAWHLQQCREICSFREALWINAGWLQGMTESASWSLREVLIRLFEAFQRWIPASAKSQRRRFFVAEEKKSEMRWPFWRVMAGCIAIGSRTAADSFFFFFLVLHKPMDLQFHCVIIKMLQLKRKK